MARWVTRFDWTDWLNRQSRRTVAAMTIGFVLVIGVADYSTSTEVSFSVIYAFPIALATWLLGMRFAYGLACAATLIYALGDYIGGTTYSYWLIPIWNALIRFVFFALIIQLLGYIRTLNSSLEERVARRTADLRREIAERERLERELLEVSERERSRLGYDLHDGLCQHLTGTALAVHVLREKLARKGVPEAKEAENAVKLIEEGIQLSHSLAKGLQPVDVQSSGLMQALQEFAKSTTELFKIACRFDCDSPVLIDDVSASNQLYRIVQEATSNAIKHGRATRVVISLDVEEEGTVLRVRDNGVGIRPLARRSGGLGLKIMAQRAKLIGARFSVQPNPAGGTMISCILPQPADAYDMPRASASA